MLKALAVISVIFFSGFFSIDLFIDNNGGTIPGNPPDPEKNYKEYCAGCHGEMVEMFVDRKWKYGKERHELFKAINTGYPNDGMPGFDASFTDAEVNELVDYILDGLKTVERYGFVNQEQKQLSYTGRGLQIELEPVVTGLKSPWGMVSLPKGEMLFTEKGGQLFRVSKTGEQHLISGVPEVIAEGQGGLLDVMLHPQFRKNKLVYLSYSKPKNENNQVLTTTAIMVAKLEGNQLTNQQVIFEALPYSRTRHHYGSRMVFGKDGKLYFSVGDRGNQKENPQNLENDLGKIHRINADGSVPMDNPFAHTKNAKPTIYSYGHRNPQGLVIHPESGALWSHEHGPRGGDEINLVQKGKNYGWPVISYGINYNGTTFTDKTQLPGMEQPLLYWIPSIAPSGMAFINSKKYKQWQGDLLSGSLRFKYLNLSSVNGQIVKDEAILFENVGRLRDVEMSPDGYIYIAVENPGTIYRLQPK